MQVRKRNGDLQELDLNKIHHVLTWACDGYGDGDIEKIKGVSISQIEMNARLHLYDGIATKDIHETLIKAASELISLDTPNYDHVAARLVWFSVRKEAFGKNVPPHLSEIIRTNIERGVYSRDILDYYDQDDIDELNKIIVHSRDDLFRYAGAEQMRKKYLAQNRKTKQLYESFQVPYIMVAALLFAKYPKDIRMQYVKNYYDMISQHYISLPTPIMAGLRTKVKQFSSCTVIEAGDSLDSINATAAAIVNYASRKAGIGLGIGRIRAEGQPVRNGDAVTTGVIPFAKYFTAALKSCSQGAVRGAAATLNYPIWHLEFERLIELKNEKGTEETRIRTVDYSVHVNRVFYERLVNNEDITFFSPEEVPELYDAFYSSDLNKFKELYEEFEKTPYLTKKVLPAKDVFLKILQERYETGRIYIMNADHVNSHKPFYENIVMSNLCQEIALPTRPLGNEDSLIGLCTLSAINWGKFKGIRSLEEKGEKWYQKEDEILREACHMAVRALDALLDYQEYPLPEAARHTHLYRPLGIGIIGFAHWLAKNRLLWGAEDTQFATEEFMERMAYYLTEASIELAKEYGPTPARTLYSDGVFPIDNSFIPANTHMNWDELRVLAKEYGTRNSTLMALMPSETSSQLANETNGIEPPRELLTVKGSKDGVMSQIVPEYNRLGGNYETLWNVSVEDYLKTTAIFQKYVDQAISLNTSYDPSKVEMSTQRLMKDLLLAYKLGHKTLYYCNTRDGSGDAADDGCESGACKI